MGETEKEAEKKFSLSGSPILRFLFFYPDG